MATNQKQEKRILDLLKSFDSGAVQPKELIDVAKALLVVVKDGQTATAAKIAKNKGILDDSIKKAISSTEDKLKVLKQSIEDTNAVSRKSTSEQIQELSMVIEEVRKQIPEMPESFDSTEILNSLGLHLEAITNLTAGSAPEKIRDALEELEGDERLHVDAIRGIEEMIKSNIPESKNNFIPPESRTFFSDVDISDQLDGASKTFSIPATFNVISVHMSSFPNALRKTIDFTYTDTTITFTSEIDAATSLAAGQTVVLTVVTA